MYSKISLELSINTLFDSVLVKQRIFLWGRFSCCFSKAPENPREKNLLDTRISFILRPSVLCHAQGTPPVFWNGLDWRALVECRIPNIGKLRGQHFLLPQKNNFSKIKKFWRKKGIFWKNLQFFSDFYFFILFDIFNYFLDFLKIFQQKN